MGASTTGPQRSNLTHVDGTPITSSGGKPYAVGILAGVQGSVSFGSTDVSHTSSLGLGAGSTTEIELVFTGPFTVTGADGYEWTVHAEVTGVNTVTMTKTAQNVSASAAFLPATTHYYNARRVVLP